MINFLFVLCTHKKMNHLVCAHSCRHAWKRHSVLWDPFPHYQSHYVRSYKPFQKLIKLQLKKQLGFWPSVFLLLGSHSRAFIHLVTAKTILFPTLVYSLPIYVM